MNATTTTPDPAILRGGRLHCPSCARELDIWEETRNVDRIAYTAPRWDGDNEEWTYTAHGNAVGVAVELIARYAQCPATSCAYSTDIEDRYDAAIADATDDWTCPGCLRAVEATAATTHAAACHRHPGTSPTT